MHHLKEQNVSSLPDMGGNKKKVSPCRRRHIEPNAMTALRPPILLRALGAVIAKLPRDSVDSALADVRDNRPFEMGDCIAFRMRIATSD